MLMLGWMFAFTAIGTLFFSTYKIYIVEQQRTQYAAQAAALAAACDLSNIVVADPRWGFVSLSNHPACGTATTAPDSEALPVTGINTIAGTVRTEKLLAQKLDDNSLRDLAQDDYKEYIRAKASLQSVLNQAISPSCKSMPKDMNGRAVKVYQSAYQSFLKNMPLLKSGKARLKSFSLSLGWLEVSSTTALPNPLRPTATFENDEDCYQSFVNLPVEKDDFYFAGLSSQVRLVEQSRYRNQDGKRFSCCLLVKTEIEILSDVDKLSGSSKQTVTATLSSVAAALPYCEQNYCAPGALVIYLPQGQVERIDNLRDLLTARELKQTKEIHSVASGDFPADKGSALVQDLQSPHSIAHSTGRALFDWLKTGNAKVRLDSILEALNQPFQNKPNKSETDLAVIYTIDRFGDIKVVTLHDSGFQNKIVADKQTQDTAYNILATPKGSLCIDVRNEVADQGTTDSGKHGGQPLSSELPAAFTHFLSEDEMRKINTKQQIRDSYHKGGLAAAIELYFKPSGIN